MLAGVDQSQTVIYYLAISYRMGTALSRGLSQPQLCHFLGCVTARLHKPPEPVSLRPMCIYSNKQVGVYVMNDTFRQQI